MKASEILDRCAVQLNDVEHVRWTVAMLLDYLTDACRQTVLNRPDANAVVRVVELEPARSRQRIPEDTVMLLKAVRNTNQDGTEYGKPLTMTTREAMDICFPMVGDDFLAEEIEQYAFVQATPEFYWVYPLPDSGVFLELECAADVAQITSLDDEIPLSSVWAEPLREYVLYRAFGLNAASSADSQRATSHLQQFYLLLGNQKAARVLGNPYNQTASLAAPQEAR